ncbi:hypothetical protein Golob_014746 [Gossypium lobatum]|uniref:Uncharacterized protein n=1 Tax=Gossypium lobatum TaxID=34289 RepID=A0A7J8LZ09_9ROSI|nr:hypothetical protein [Gossypium lobatum]
MKGPLKFNEPGSSPNKGTLGKRATPAAKSGPESDGQLPYVSTQDDHNQVQSNSCFNVVCFENFSALSAVGANASGLEPSMQANEFDGIKVHFSATFEGPVGVAVQLSDGVLDPDKYTVVIFKENSHPNSHELAEGRNFEALGAGSLGNKDGKNSGKFGIGRGVVILISSKMVNETGNGAQDEVASNLDGAVDSQ